MCGILPPNGDRCAPIVRIAGETDTHLPGALDISPRAWSYVHGAVPQPCTTGLNAHSSRPSGGMVLQMKNPHIRLRGRSFYWRRRVPASLLALLGRCEFVFALGTRSFDEALLKARRLTVAADEVFAMLDRKSELTRAAATPIARDWFLAELAEMEGCVADEGPRNHARLEKLDKLLPLLTAYRQSVLVRNSTDFMDGVAKQCLEDRGLDCVPTSPEFGHLKLLLLRAHAEAIRHYERWLEGDFTVSPTDQLLRGTDLHSERAASAPSVEGNPKQSSPAQTGTPFSVLAAKFATEMEGSQQWRGQTAKQNRLTYRLFVEVLGDQPLRSYSRRDVAKFYDTIRELPRTYGKSVKDKDKSISELVAGAPGRPTLSTTTLARHMRALSALFNWGAKRGEFEGTNPATGFGERRKGRARDQRNAWTPSQLRTLFQSPIYTGCRSENWCNSRGNLIPRTSPRFWVPLIGAFTGMRVDEICQLYVTDIRCDQELWYFDIRNEGEQRTKTDASVRRVPIHDELARCGFFEYLEAVRAKKHRELFPTLIRGGADNKPSHAFVKWFSRYRARLTDCSDVCFHSFRHTVKTALLQAGVERHIANDLLGHEHDGMDARYYKGSLLSQLKAAVDCLQYPGLDLTHLYWPSVRTPARQP